MDETEDPLIKAIMEAGLYGQRLQPFQQRAALGQQFMQTPGAQGAQVGNTYRAASPFEHLSNALRQVMGAKMVGDSQRGQQDLTSQLGAGRQAYAQALQVAGGTPQPGTPEMLARPADPQRMQQLAMMGALSADPGMQRASQAAMQERHLSVQEQQMQDMMRHRLTLEGQGQQRIGLQAGHLDAINQRLAQQGVRWNSNTGQFENIGPLVKPTRKPVLPGATGAAAPAAPPGSPPSGGSGAPSPPPPVSGAAPLGKWQDKALKDLGSDFNPSSGRAGEFGKNQARLNAATRLLTLAVDPHTGGPADLTPQQMSEVSSSLATLIGGGGSSEASRHEMTPYTKGRSMAELVQWFTDAPHGAGQQAFVKQMIDTAKREQGVAQQGIDQVRSQLVAKHQRILRSNPEEARKVLQGFGWDLGPDGLPVQAQQAAPAPATGTAALRKKYGL